MTKKQILDFAKKNKHEAVYIEWVDPVDDWHHFRIERVDGKRIAFTGMIDNNGWENDGDFFWSDVSEIMAIELRAE